MENKDLLKAISQIKFPVRYDEIDGQIRDANRNLIVHVYSDHAFGHALAEMINGLDGRGKESCITCGKSEDDMIITSLGFQCEECFGLKPTKKEEWINHYRTDRQVKSAEENKEPSHGK